MDREKSETPPDLGGVVKKINELAETPPIEKTTKVPFESKLLKRLKPEELKEAVDEMNELRRWSNSDENLEKGLWFERPAEEEKNVVPNPEEKAFFEILREKQQEEEAINVVPRPPMARKFRRLTKDADEEIIMSEGEKKILEGYAEYKRKAKDQRVGEYIEGLKKEREEQDKKFPDIIGDMEKEEPTVSPPIISPVVNKPKGEVPLPSPVDERNKLRRQREVEHEEGMIRTSLEQEALGRAQRGGVEPDDKVKKMRRILKESKEITNQ